MTEAERENLADAAPKQCGDCRWFNPDFAPADDPSEVMGLCEWPASRLPYSLRHGNRERAAVCPLDGAACPCHETLTHRPEDARR